MKRTDITELFSDAPKEAIDKLMSINGADVNAVKTELEGLRQQLTEAQAKIPDAEKLQKAQQQITQLTTELDGMKAAETVRLTREKVAGEKNIPASLLTGETEDACVKQADAILAFAKPSGYPQHRDGGEVSAPQKLSTRDSFANWANEQLN